MNENCWNLHIVWGRKISSVNLFPAQSFSWCNGSFFLTYRAAGYMSVLWIIALAGHRAKAHLLPIALSVQLLLKKKRANNALNATCRLVLMNISLGSLISGVKNGGEIEAQRVFLEKVSRFHRAQSLQCQYQLRKSISGGDWWAVIMNFTLCPNICIDILNQGGPTWGLWGGPFGSLWKPCWSHHPFQPPTTEAFWLPCCAIPASPLEKIQKACCTQHCLHFLLTELAEWLWQLRTQK